MQNNMKRAAFPADIQVSPVTRYRDIVQQCCGVSPTEMTTACYENLGRGQAAARETTRRAVDTLQAWERERRRFRNDYETVLGPAPPLQVEILDRGTVEFNDAIIRKLLFSSFADNWITANLYLPRAAGRPLPGVIYACGHSNLGKHSAVARGLNLAANGYAALIFDLPGAGERRLANVDARCYPASTQHNILGWKLILAGGSLGRIFVQDTMAAVSVLQQCGAVDPERIGMTGGSGGGWLTVHAAALDERIKVAIPAAAVGSRRFDVIPDDVEQSHFDMQRLGIDYPDLLGLLLCPRPVFIVANKQDIWSLASTEYARGEAARFYDLQGCGDHFGMQVWDRGHAYKPDQFAVAMRWFNRHLKADADAPVVEIDENAVLPDAESLQVCETGNIRGLGKLQANTVYWRVLERTSCREKKREAFLETLKASVAVPAPVAWAGMDAFDYGNGSGRRICYAPEAGILLPVEVLTPPDARHVVILLDESDRRTDLDWQLETAASGAIVFRPDLRGWGEAANEEQWSDWEGWTLNLYAGKRARLQALACITGRSLVLDRVRDVVALLSVVEALAPGKPVSIHGRRGGAWIALLAGLADQRIASLTLERYPASFKEAMTRDMPIQYPDCYLPGLLTWGLDVDDLVKAFDRQLITCKPLNALMQLLANGTVTPEGDMNTAYFNRGLRQPAVDPCRRPERSEGNKT